MLIRSLVSAALGLVLTATATLAQCAGSDMRATIPISLHIAIEKAVAAEPFAIGNHWRATRGARTITLIGTFHLDDPAFGPIVARLEPVIASADLLLVEAAPEAKDAFQAQMASDPSILFRPTGPTLPDQLDEDTWQAIASAARDRQMPTVMAAKMQPWFLSLMLSMPPCAVAAMQANAGGLDQMIVDRALQAGVPVAGLEQPSSVMDGFNSLAPEAQLNMLVWTLASQDSAEDLFHTTRMAYFSEEHAYLWHFGIELARANPSVPEDALNATSEQVEEVILTRRNRAWIDVIEAAEGMNIVVAAGAAHLFGEDGVLNLLQQRGYQLTRQDF